ncbi:hypothetical protein J3R82DRAFT_11038 [Butyriboletus roseoflavus]|nr:hypothetical protein J3R82DRAFT_11038 [Butyriboletus roseoflavus]
MGWLAKFTNRCILTLEMTADEASSTENHDEALAAYSAALLLSLTTPNTLLSKWASMVLIHGSANEALTAAAKFKLPRFVIYRVICDILEGDGRVTEAVECFRQMQSELEDRSTHDWRAQWELDFRGRCVEKLEKLGDTAMNSQNYDAAIGQYSDALALDPTNQSDILLKRSEARVVMGSWEEALSDAEQVTELDSSSYKGYERKDATLQAMGRHSEAFGTFKVMLLKLEQSPDPHIQLLQQYIDATSTIRRAIDQTIRHMPRVLINTTTSRLYDKPQQAAAFEELPIYDELRSSMTIRLDHAHIWREVNKFYRYVMFSHRWEHGEPLFQRVENISVYELESSSPNIKLQTFCTFIRSLGFQWVWSDTCCIDRKDNVVLQESLVAMFTWYRGSSLTIAHPRGVWSQFQQPGDLRKNIWNTRAWTLQEYIAAETVQFYTEDWKPYLGVDMFNHKESPAIISEMQQAAGVLTQELAVLRPGLESVREKLYLASLRSGEVTLLAWTGRAGSYNTCLPSDLTVYDQLVPLHVPQPIETAEMDSMVTALHATLPDLSQVVMLHSRLNELSSPFFAASRLRLPGMVFPLIGLLRTLELGSNSDFDVYRATTGVLGDVEIKTTDDLSGKKDLLLIHPWISPLLDQEFSYGAAMLDKTMRALRFLARLRQPFGALLLVPLSRMQYRRIAADCLIMVQVREEASLTELMHAIRMVDIQ